MKRTIIMFLLCAASCATWAQGNSPLARGDWWRMTVDKAGIYRLTVANLPEIEGVSIDSIGIYGAGAGMLSTGNMLTSTQGLYPLAIELNDHNGNGLFDTGDELLFYAEGADRWQYVATDDLWEFDHHAYSNHNYYFLGTSSPQPLRISQSPNGAAEHEIESYTAVAHIDNDLVNIFASGQKWMGEKFSSALTQRTFGLDLPAGADDSTTLRAAVANGDYTDGTYNINTASYHGSISIDGTTVYSTHRGVVRSNATHFDVTIQFVPGSNASTGHLDYIEMTRNATSLYTGKQTLQRYSPTTHATARHTIANANSSTRVWAVGKPGTEREMTLSGNGWVDSADRARAYIVFGNNDWLTPTAIVPLANQDLHSASQADMVLVSHPSLMAQTERLASLHEIVDGLTTLTVTDQTVFNEYSSGMPDPMAIRSLLRDLAARYPSAPPRYLLLMGKATYDNRNLLGNSHTTLVTYETPYSFDDQGASYCSDDMLGYLDPSERGSASEKLDVSVGRLPAKNLAEAEHMVDKIEGYLMLRDLQTDNERGDWRNSIALLADDADPSKPYDTAFVHSSEVVAASVSAQNPYINIDKFYADAYHQSTGAIGSYYPDLNNALRQRINTGCLLINYIGHGSTSYVGTERYIELSDLDGYTNTDRLPLFVTSTCSYGRIDILEELCGAEAALLAPAAMVAVISASRPINHIERFNNDVVRYALDPNNTIGDALRLAKNRTPVAQCIGLMGDPALRLSIPNNRVVVTAINNQPVTEGKDDTATVLSRVTVSGEIHDTAGAIIPDFDGTIYPVVFDRPIRTSTLANDNPGTEVSFSQQKNILYRGSHTISNGRFEYSFIVPKDVATQYAHAKLSHYARSASDHATGCYTRLLLGGINDTATLGTTAPVVQLYMGDTNFRSGGLTGTSPTLLAILTDSTGINAGAGLGHDITAVIDGNPGSLVVLNDLYRPNVENPTGGTVSYHFTDLAPGRHTLTLKAWNIYNISAESTIEFTVCNPDTLSLSRLVCAPNPASGRTTISMETNNIGRIATAELQIYNSYGQCIATVTPPLSADGYTVGPYVWELATVPPGIYLARFIVTEQDGTIHQRSTKCIVK